MADTESSPETEPSPAPAKKKGCVIGYFIAGIIGLFLLFGSLTPGRGVSERGKRIEDISTIKNLVTGCRLYADDWDGRFPEKLRDLYPDYIDDEGLFWTNAYKKKELKDFIYFAGLTNTNYSTQPLIASPFVNHGKRVVGYVGGHVSVTSEERFQELLKSAEKKP